MQNQWNCFPVDVDDIQLGDSVLFAAIPGNILSDIIKSLLSWNY